jgi:hypothetical protein
MSPLRGLGVFAIDDPWVKTHGYSTWPLRGSGGHAVLISSWGKTGLTK